VKRDKILWWFTQKRLCFFAKRLQTIFRISKKRVSKNF